MYAVDTVRQAWEATREAGTARFEWRQDQDWSGVGDDVPRWFQVTWKTVFRNVDFAHHRGSSGMLDLHERRFCRSGGATGVEVGEGDRRWFGRPGRALDDAHDREAPDPLWLLQVLEGLTDATDRGRGSVFGRRCRRFGVTVDVARASEATPGGLPSPARGRYEDLLALVLEVLVDDHVRRVTFAENEIETKSVLLWDVGVPLDGVDWTRLPRDPAGG